MTQHADTLRELTHKLFDGKMSAEEYRRAVARPEQMELNINEAVMSRTRQPSLWGPKIVLGKPLSIIGNDSIRDLFLKAHVKSRFKVVEPSNNAAEEMDFADIAELFKAIRRSGSDKEVYISSPFTSGEDTVEAAYARIRRELWDGAELSARKASEAYYNQDKRCRPDAMWLGPSPIRQVSLEEFGYIERIVHNERERSIDYESNL